MKDNDKKQNQNISSIKFEEFLKKIESLKEKNGVDLSTTEDLSLAVMNLISLEEHFFFTAMKTGKNEYFDISADIRNTRKELLAELIPNHEGETWCASKHLLSASMRLIEVGNKMQSEAAKDGVDSDRYKASALAAFEKAYKIYSIFWALKLNLINVNKTPVQVPSESSLEDLVTKLADCCQE